MIAAIVFWTAAGLLVYTYLGYPLVLRLLVLVKGRQRRPDTEADVLPRVTALVVAHNEEAGILDKINNILDNGYPDDRIEVIVCSDGSTDRTNDLVENHGDPRVRLAASPTNVGVNEAFSMGARLATGNVFLMTDSGGMFRQGAILTAARHFADPRVGLVSGNIYYENRNQSAIGSGYHGYWFIETGVRQLESDLGFSIVTVGIFEMIRKEAYLSVPSQYNNDMAAPIYAWSLGYSCRYEPDAVAVAIQKKTPSQDMQRRIRMAVRGWSSMPFILKHVPLCRHLRIWAALISHKYLRWAGGFALLSLFVANAFLLDHLFYQIAFAGQAAFYLAGLAGWLLASRGKRVGPISLCFYFCLLQLGGMIGLIQTLAGRRYGVWKPVE